MLFYQRLVRGLCFFMKNLGYILCMEHHGYTRNASAVFSLKYHLVFCPKYRKSVLLGLVAERLKALLATKAAALHVTLHTLEVMPDYVHIFVESDPGMPPAKLAAVQRRYLAYHAPRISTSALATALALEPIVRHLDRWTMASVTHAHFCCTPTTEELVCGTDYC